MSAPMLWLVETAIPRREALFTQSEEPTRAHSIANWRARVARQRKAGALGRNARNSKGIFLLGESIGEEKWEIIK